VNVETRAWISTLFRLVLAGVWLWAGLVKLIEPGGARDAIIAYRVFPAWSVDFLGWALPAVEVALGALLLVGLFTRVAAAASALLFLGFIVGISSVWIRGYSIDCGCFGGGGNVGEEGKAWRYTSELLRDFLFMGMAVWLVAWPTTKLSLDREPLAFDDFDDDTTDETEPLEEQPR
jgi:uncharacterized membrane protein YphA (DoxX/SURF4 family)